jgi:hypothetical protein
VEEYLKVNRVLFMKDGRCLRASLEFPMPLPKKKWLGVIGALVLGLTPLAFPLAWGAESTEIKTNFYKGKVVPLADLLEKIGSKLDRDAAPHWLALVTDDGKVYPLIKDAGSRVFFNDPHVLNRPMRIAGRLFQDTHLLQVISVNSYIKGELQDIYYWCDVCSIRRSEKQTQCDCCGGPMELREIPLKK